MLTITIGAAIGIDGSVVAHEIAERLGIRCVDGGILGRMAAMLDVTTEQLEAYCCGRQSVWTKILSSYASGSPDGGLLAHPPTRLCDDAVVQAQGDVLRDIAAEGDAVVLDQTAHYHLSRQAGMVHVLLHAPLAYRIRRLVETERAASAAEARRVIVSAGRATARRMAGVAGWSPDRADSYDLCVDVSLMPSDVLAEWLSAFVRAIGSAVTGKAIVRFGEEPSLKLSR